MFSMLVIRFIYAYKSVATKKYVYVGSTKNPHERHRLRTKRTCCPFDRELTSRPAAYTMEIVEAFRADTDEESKRIAVLRENQWMDVLGTFRTPHGFNFQRADIPYRDRSAWLFARQRAQTTPEALAKKSEAQRRAMASCSKEAMQAMINGGKKSGKIMAARQCGKKVTAQEAERLRIIGKENGEKLRGVPRTKESKEKMRAAHRTPEGRAKLAARLQASPLHAAYARSVRLNKLRYYGA